jgi:hypothetical protein
VAAEPYRLVSSRARRNRGSRSLHRGLPTVSRRLQSRGKPPRAEIERPAWPRLHRKPRESAMAEHNVNQDRTDLGQSTPTRQHGDRRPCVDVRRSGLDVLRQRSLRGVARCRDYRPVRHRHRHSRTVLANLAPRTARGRRVILVFTIGPWANSTPGPVPSKGQARPPKSCYRSLQSPLG